MAWILNKSERAINIGGVLLTPTVPAEIDDSFLQNERVMELIADGDLEKTNAPSSDNKLTTSVTAESGQHGNPSQPTNNSSANRSASGTTTATTGPAGTVSATQQQASGSATKK